MLERSHLNRSEIQEAIRDKAANFNIQWGAKVAKQRAVEEQRDRLVSSTMSSVEEAFRQAATGSRQVMSPKVLSPRVPVDSHTHDAIRERALRANQQIALAKVKRDETEASVARNLEEGAIWRALETERHLAKRHDMHEGIRQRAARSNERVAAVTAKRRATEDEKAARLEDDAGRGAPTSGHVYHMVPTYMPPRIPLTECRPPPFRPPRAPGRTSEEPPGHWSAPACGQVRQRSDPPGLTRRVLQTEPM